MKYKTFKQKLTVALAAMMIIASSTASFAANFNDLSQASWAKTMIEEWSSKEMVSGYPDGTFRPNSNITRAEFATLVQNAFNLESEEMTQFEDISSDAWYYNAVGTLASLGVVGGYEDGTFRPNGQITRAEAAAIMANLKGLEAQTDIALSFYDYDSMPSWARRHIGAVLDAGVMNGYPDNTFRASNTITRAESVATLNNVLNPTAVSQNLVINEAGTYGGTEIEHKIVAGNVVVNVEDVTLKNMVIEGNLILAEGIQEGDAILENVTVKGDTEVSGGGANSIYIRNSRLANIIVDKKNNSIRIVAEGTSTFGTIIAKSGVKLEEKNLVNSEGFGEVIIEEGAEGEIILEGNFTKVTVRATGITLRLPENSKIAEITVEKPIKVVGQGTIEKAVVSVNGVDFEKAPTKVESAPGKNVTIIVGGKEQTITPPSSGGGGGGGGITTPVVQPIQVSSVKASETNEGDKLDIVLANFNLTKNPTAKSVDITRTVDGVEDQSFNYTGGSSIWSKDTNTLTIEHLSHVENDKAKDKEVIYTVNYEKNDTKVASNKLVVKAHKYEYELHVSYGSSSAMEIISDRDKNLTDQYLDFIFDSGKALDFFAEVQDSKEVGSFINELLVMESNNGTNYSQKVAEDILLAMKDGKSFFKLNPNLVQDIKDNEMSDSAVKQILWSVFDGPIWMIEEDLNALYPNKTLGDLNKNGLSVYVAGEKLSDSVKVGNFRNAIVTKLNNKKLSDLNGEAVLEIKLNGRSLQLVIKQVEKSSK